ncbi:acetyltransferase [Quisquiliibacterium transsilvanicum]|jgi:hypothetical protein|uniref:Acetyltransferase n=1 Tax=Quisquiliibacterium transsilvanicum TaxID=1549638 RepID=A0A7W8HKE6_9BURK|nr:acetyltransferase [Quisquiliibacterium transsilvanicum]MBB5272813.1 hypothetical protein [Quisquiliibacterium transsilvanicum]
MTRFDVFNGDADGLCALQQLRLDDPQEAVLVTGAKRDNALLERVPAQAGDLVTALDIAMPGNRAALVALLGRGVRVRYVDHHEPGEVPDSPLLELTIDTSPDVCTSALADRLVEGRQRPWAIVGCFGDNMNGTAQGLAAALGLDDARRARWQELGECLNYNAYGLSEEDLVYRPAQLYGALSPYADPDRFIEQEPHFERLRQARSADLERALECPAELLGRNAVLHLLPDAAWARRVSGSFANHALNADPERAHAIATPRPGTGLLQVSLRLPRSSAASAHELVRPFGGGGRRGAAGIDALDPSELPRLAERLAALD